MPEVSNRMGAVGGRAVQAGTINGDVVVGDVHHHTAAPSVPVPRQLPLPSRDFTGRVEQLDALDSLLLTRGLRPPVLLTGTAGAGKTTLATQWGHRNVDSFPDGQLHADLHGFTPDQAQVATIQVLERFLKDLGTRPEALPRDLDGCVAAYRTLLVERRLLVVLDNVGSAAQVLPLLMTSPHCRVLLTSRTRLPGLDVEHLSVEVFTPAESEVMLRRILGAERVDHEHLVATEIARQCAQLPLALRVAAERIRHRPHHALTDLSAELDDEKLAALELPGDALLAVGPAISLSYRSLDLPSARMFRLLGVQACADISEAAVIALTQMEPRQAKAALAVLLNAHVLEEFERGRYRFHDLLRAYARKQADEIDSEAERVAAVRRLTTWYAAMADHADHMLAEHRARLHPDLRERAPAAGFGSRDEAMSWCETELTNIELCLKQAHRLGIHDLTWQVPAALQGFFYLARHVSTWHGTHELGLLAATASGDAAGTALMHHGIACAYRFRQYDRWAIHHGEQALVGFRESGNRRFQGIVLSNIGLSHMYIEERAEAHKCLAESLTLAREVGDRHAEAWALTNLGSVLRRGGEHSKSLEALLPAVRTSVSMDDLDSEAWTQVELGRTYVELRLSEEAENAFERAIGLHRAHGNTYGLAKALDHLGAHFDRTGQVGRARMAWQEALPLFDDLRDTDATLVRGRLSRLSDGGS